MADIPTETGWASLYRTFDEDADLVARLTVAYIHVFQGKALGSESVACMIKHFPGGGPKKMGWMPTFHKGAYKPILEITLPIIFPPSKLPSLMLSLAYLSQSENYPLNFPSVCILYARQEKICLVTQENTLYAYGFGLHSN
jgi:hypothetical protein